MDTYFLNALVLFLQGNLIWFILLVVAYIAVGFLASMKETIRIVRKAILVAIIGMLLVGIVTSLNNNGPRFKVRSGVSYDQSTSTDIQNLKPVIPTDEERMKATQERTSRGEIPR